MAWKWLDAASGMVVGVAGIAGGAWVAGRGRRHDERMAKARFEHEQRSAHAQWLRERWAEAYILTLGGSVVVVVKPDGDGGVWRILTHDDQTADLWHRRRAGQGVLQRLGKGGAVPAARVPCG